MTKIVFWTLTLLSVYATMKFYDKDGFNAKCENAGGVAIMAANKSVCLKVTSIMSDP